MDGSEGQGEREPVRGPSAAALDPGRAQPLELIVDTRGAAQFLGLHWRTVQQLARAGELPARSVAGQWRFSLRALSAFVAGATYPAYEPPWSDLDHDVVGTDEAMALLGIPGRPQVWEQIAAGLPSRLVGRRRRVYSRSAIHAWLTGRDTPTTR